MIKIGFNAYNAEARFIKGLFKRSIERYYKNSDLLFYQKEKYCYDALNAGNEISAIAVSLENLPTTLPDGLVIAAFSGRNACEINLVTFPPTSYSDALFNLPENPMIATFSDIISKQFQEIIPTASFTNRHHPDEVLFELEGELHFMKNSKEELGLDDEDEIVQTFHGGLVPQNYLTGYYKISDGDLEATAFDPAEITSLPGAGIVAFLTKADDLNTRRFLKDIHNEECGELVNVERKLKKMFNDKDIAAYCNKDDNGNYHLFAAAIVNGKLKRTRISQSTFFELAEKGFSQLVG